MIGMAVGDNDQIYVFRGERKSVQLISYVIEEVVVAWIYQYPLFTIDEIGVAVVGGHAVPGKDMQMVQ
jgi:hypothetical protein